MKYEIKLALQIFLLGAPLLLVGYFISYRYSYKTILRKEFEQTSSLVDEMTANFEQLLLEKVKTNRTFSISPIIKAKLVESNDTYANYSDKQRGEIIKFKNEKWRSIKDENNSFILKYTNNEVAQFLKEQQKNLPGEYGEIFLTNKYGVVIASTSKLTTFAHANKYWWKGAYENGKGAVFFDDRGYDESVDGYVLGIVIPIKNNNKIIGILKVNLNILGSISKILTRTQNETVGKFKLVRSGGEIIFDNKTIPLSKRIPDLFYEKIQVSDKKPFIFHDSIGSWLVGMSDMKISSNKVTGFRFGGSFKSIDHVKGNTGESWFIINYRNIKSIVQPLNNYTLTFFAIGFLLIIILAIDALILGKLTAKPLKQLIEQSNKIAKAEFKPQIKVNRKDEIGLLGKAFNKMAKELELNTTSVKNLESEINLRIKAEQEFKVQVEKYTTLNEKLIFAKEKIEESERKYRLLFENSPLGTYIADVDGTIKDINQTALNQLGSPSKEATKQINVLKFPPLIKNGYARKFIECLNTGEVKLIEIEYKSKWGKELFLSSYMIPLKDKTGNVGLIYTIMDDITDRIIAEQSLKTSEAKLRESNKTKDKFFSIIAHDLKSPFNSILGFSKILLDNHKEYDDYKRERLIELVNNSANSAFRLLENLLTWSRTQSGVIKYSPEKLYLKILLFETISNLQGQINKKGINILDNIPENETIYADINMISTVLRNLISNAIKFTNKNGHVKISSKKQIVTNIIEISVEDTGVGMSKDKIDNLFLIEKNISTRGTEQETGTGLGLLLCKEFVENHGGEIWVESKEGVGSKFTFTIPNKEID